MSASYRLRQCTGARPAVPWLIKLNAPRPLSTSTNFPKCPDRSAAQVFVNWPRILIATSLRPRTVGRWNGNESAASGLIYWLHCNKRQIQRDSVKPAAVCLAAAQASRGVESHRVWQRKRDLLQGQTWTADFKRRCGNMNAKHRTEKQSTFPISVKTCQKFQILSLRNLFSVSKLRRKNVIGNNRHSVWNHCYRVSGRHALAGTARYCSYNLSVRPSVRPSRCRIVWLYLNDCIYRQTIMINWYGHHPRFLGPNDRFKIPKETPSAWALNARGEKNYLYVV